MVSDFCSPNLPGGWLRSKDGGVSGAFCLALLCSLTPPSLVNAKRAFSSRLERTGTVILIMMTSSQLPQMPSTSLRPTTHLTPALKRYFYLIMPRPIVNVQQMHSQPGRCPSGPNIGPHPLGSRCVTVNSRMVGLIPFTTPPTTRIPVKQDASREWRSSSRSAASGLPGGYLLSVEASSAPTPKIRLIAVLGNSSFPNQTL